MLLEFGIKNFFSFKEGVTISLELGENCPKDISKGLTYSKILGIKGANASGKTNILRAFSFLYNFVTKSFDIEPEKKLAIRQFFKSNKPSEFYVDFKVGNINYIYELHADASGVKYESIYRKVKRKTKLFERVENKVVLAVGDFEILKTIKLRSNASVISTAHQHDVKAIKEIYDYFRSWITNVTYSGLNEGLSIYQVAENLKKDERGLEFIKEFIRSCDGGVDDIVIEAVTTESGEIIQVPFFIHQNLDKNHKVNHLTESSGTRTLFKHLLMYYLVLELGGLLILDEFDINLHPHILPKLLDLFENENTNKRCAQLIFTTHNGEVLDRLTKYRSYLVNKEDNESYAYRLDAIPGEILRNDRPILPVYDRGDIGGVPRV